MQQPVAVVAAEPASATPDATPPVARPAATLRPRATINLKEITTAPRPAHLHAQPVPQADKPVREDELKKAWNTYAELQRNQVAEYQLLNREIKFEENQVVVQLTNPFEEQLLQTLQADLTTFLRVQLQNSQLTVRSNLLAAAPKKMIYTNREKFEFLQEKHPAISDLRDRFGLDADF